LVKQLVKQLVTQPVMRWVMPWVTHQEKDGLRQARVMDQLEPSEPLDRL
jgi:hypothetical protein